MDCCRPYPVDYRATSYINSVSSDGIMSAESSGIATAAAHHASYHGHTPNSTMLRYPSPHHQQQSAASMYRNGMLTAAARSAPSSASSSLYDGGNGFNRYTQYPNNPMYNPSYSNAAANNTNNTPTGYHMNHHAMMRENAYYHGHYGAGEGYNRMPPSYNGYNGRHPLYHANESMYSRNGFLAREAQLSSPVSAVAAASSPGYGGYNGNGVGSHRDYTAAYYHQYHPHHYQGPRDFYNPQLQQHHQLSMNEANEQMLHHIHPGSIYSPAPPPAPFSNNPNLNSTGFPFTGKETTKSRKSRNQEKSLKLAANRKLDTSTPVIGDIERIGTPFSTLPLQNFLDSPNGYMPYQQSSWHAAGVTGNGGINSNTWIDAHYSKRPHRKRSLHRSPEPQNSTKLTKRSGVGEQNGSRDRLITNGVFELDFIPSKKKKKHKSDAPDEVMAQNREELQNITPLPGFQQAFGSTEIGRFSEIFFNAPESPIEHSSFENEGDTLSPQLWETGDSLEGPHFNLQVGATVQSVYPESYSSTDSPGSYFSEIRCNDF